MEMIEVKTAELVGPALDWAVAQAIGADQVEFGVVGSAAFIACIHRGTWERNWRPSTDWSQGGPLFDRHDILLGGLTGRPYAVVNNFPNGCGTRQNGPTKLIAACRAVVAAKLGDTVRVPVVMVEGEA